MSYLIIRQYIKLVLKFITTRILRSYYQKFVLRDDILSSQLRLCYLMENVLKYSFLAEGTWLACQPLSLISEV
jgi:hypothetical protein